MKKIWIDVTTTMNWNRPAVGILRVEQELIKHAIERKDCVRFFANDKDTFFEVSLDKITAKLSENHSFSKIRNEVKKVEVNKKSLLKLNSLRLKAAIYFFLLSIYEFPLSFVNDESYVKLRSTHQFKFQQFKLAVKKTLKKTRDLGKSSKVQKKVSSSEYKQLNSIFDDGDTIISIGLSWDHGEKFRYFYDLKKAQNLKVISMCYDIIPIKYPNLTISRENYEKFESNYVSMTWASDTVLCISKSSQADYVEWIESRFLPMPKTDVITLGSTIKQFDIEKISENIKNINEKFIIYVSTIERRKNHETIIKAIQYLVDKKSEYIPRVIFVGMKGWGVNDLLNDYELHPTIKNHVSMYHDINDDDLSYMYKNCEFFVYPSFYEGWGLPIAEGLTYGKFGICSLTSSIPEVGGDLLDYVYPYDVVGWANKIEFYMKNSDLLEERQQMIKNSFTDYNWIDFGKKILAEAE